jgi:hypothetical protein
VSIIIMSLSVINATIADTVTIKGDMQGIARRS